MASFFHGAQFVSEKGNSIFEVKIFLLQLLIRNSQLKIFFLKKGGTKCNLIFLESPSLTRTTCRLIIPLSFFPIVIIFLIRWNKILLPLPYNGLRLQIIRGKSAFTRIES
uniref:Uncharacterized protein n=1 Tax=Lepeophtheirus salmonis TaxID=72036 RepID=A0A0K2VFR6_LEPSM